MNNPIRIQFTNGRSAGDGSGWQQERQNHSDCKLLSFGGELCQGDAKNRIFTFLMFCLIFFACVSCKEFEENIIVTYYHGPTESKSKLTPPVFEEITEDPSDTLYISKECFEKLKEYAASKEALEHSNNVDVRLLMTIDTIKTYFGVFPYGYNPSEKVQEMEYLIKSISNYYNFFQEEDLDTINCKEIIKYGIPKNYHYMFPYDLNNIKSYHRYLLLVEK